MLIKALITSQGTYNLNMTGLLFLSLDLMASISQPAWMSWSDRPLGTFFSNTHPLINKYRLMAKVPTLCYGMNL